MDRDKFASDVATLRNVRSRKPFSLLVCPLLLAMLLLCCGGGAASRPELPASVSPDWTQEGMEHLSAPPPQVSKDGTPDCWKASYRGPGQAHVWVCRYAVEGNAFEAVQRTRAEANTVKFQEGPNFLLVQWDRATRDEITTLIRAVQGSFSHRGKQR